MSDDLVEFAKRQQAIYAEVRRAYRETNSLPGPLPGYGGRGTSVVSQHKLAVTNPKHLAIETTGYCVVLDAPPRSPEAVDEGPLG